MKKSTLFIIITIISFLSFYIFHQFKSIDDIVVSGQNCQYSKQELLKYMKYHGVLIISKNKKGEWVFKRNKQICKVFPRRR